MKTKRGNPQSPQSYALRLLGRRAYSVSGIRRKLQLRYDEPEVAEVVSWLLEKGYLDDRQLARERAVAGRTRKRWGDLRIRRDLMRQGIDAKIIAHALDRLEQLYPQDETLKQTIETWVDRQGEPDTVSGIKKIFDHCQRRGFPAERTRTLLETFWSRLDS